MVAEPEQLPEPELSPEQPLDAILRRIARGEQDALAEFYAATDAQLFGICTRILRDRHLAEDALAEVYSIIWRRAASFDPARGTALAWAATLTRRRCVDKLRARSTRSRWEACAVGELDVLELADHAPQLGPFEVAAERDERDAVQSALVRLPEQQRRAVVLAFREGLTHPEVADALKLPLGTAKSQIRRGLLQLERMLTSPEVER